MVLRFAKYDDIPVLKQIRKVCFGEDDDFLDAYFSTRFTEDNTLLYCVDNTPVASLTLLEAELVFPEGNVPVSYVFAVATLPEFRRKGIAEALSAYADDILRTRGVKASFLVPASEALFNYYTKLGYKPDIFVEESHFAAMRSLAEEVGVESAGGRGKLCFRVRKSGVLFGMIKYLPA